ncbi:MAG: tetraacyldisaccharide 4'-kinase [Candidatus Omnitrophica bacterium]|nr:tetraacyldisaccharide 4'-kinase [Candidatus Omnitrophota bacterium]
MDKLKNYFRLLAEDKPFDALSGFMYPLLELASWGYGKAATGLRSLREKGVLKQAKLPFPVISVGNLTWGGTGKTPFVEYLARKVCAYRRVPLILTRGYSHDEVDSLKHHLPEALIGVGKDRAKAAARVLSGSKRVDIAILDDGFQHTALRRDVEIVAVNSLNPFGNGKLLPRGILREPPEVLSKASIVMLTHVNLVGEEELKALRKKIGTLAPQAQVLETCMEPLFLYRAKTKTRIFLEKMSKKRVTTFAAVGTPRSFQLVLQRAGMKTVRNFEFLDHHEYTEKELEQIKQVSLSANAEEMITTEKDFFRSRDLISRVLNPLVLAARLRIVSGEGMLTDRIARLIGVRQ